ncbi:hypothetical protein BKA66DRAFT_467289 [Pyrenochaeta sp. MPI-SDFR-AT-0127]|nr:hypothetical protein BKA66DRAFT_467289 [Pyrenochaeta sp. MPI-SDFR-AT-0127]
MVYRGNPSAACGECRKRRSRCDQALPACRQCTKAGRICSGYRNTTDLIFHDESTRVAQKYSGRSSSNKILLSLRTNSTHMEEQATDLPVNLCDFVRYQPLEDLGVNFFMSKYVGDDSAVSQLYYFPAFYARTGFADPGLQQSVTAAGLAGYAKVSCRKGVSEIATRSYISAIRNINTAMSNPKEMARDSTLMSIIMASIFEVVIVPHMSGTNNCTKHLNGAVSVALLCLKFGNQTEITQKILTTLVQSVVINSWIQQVPLSPGLTELKKKTTKNKDPPSVTELLLEIVMELVQFRNELEERKHDSLIANIKKALAIDNSLSEFSKNMPQDSQYHSFRVSSESVHELAYEGYYHVYPQRFTAYLWNNVRCSQIRLHQVVLRLCRIHSSTLLPNEHDFLSAQKLVSEARINVLAMDILATVPQLSGYSVKLELYRKPTGTRYPVSCGTSSSAEVPADPSLVRRTAASQVGLKTFYYRDSSPPHVSLDSPPKRTTVPSSLCKDESPVDSPTETIPVMSIPDPASLRHMLYHLYVLRSIPHLPTAMTEWIQPRIIWLENTANPQDLVQLQNMLRKSPRDGVPVGENERNAGFGNSPSDSTANTTDGADRHVSLLAHNWLSIGWKNFGI